MALDLNPDDYGIVGSLDKKGMKKRLKEIREQIASFGPTPVASLASSIERPAAPVYGEGIPDVEYVTRGINKYRAKSQGIPDFVKDYIADSKKFTDAYAEKLAYVPEPKPEPEPEEPEPERLRLPDLSKTKKGEKIVAPERFLEGVTTKIKSDFEKNPSFDGRSFKDFLKRAKEMRPVGRQSWYGPGGTPTKYRPVNEELNELYNELKDEGMSDSDILRSAQYAGLTNVRTGKEGKSDFNQMVKSFQQGFDRQDKTKTEQVGKKTIYDWYLDQGGDKKKPMNRLLRQAGIRDYDSVNDSRKFTEFLTDKLNQNREVNIGMDKAKKAFGNRFTRSDYKAALDYKGQDKKYIKNYLKDYLKRGGKVGQNVLDIFGF